MSSIEYSCIFCDDVRQEIGGKISVIGVYANDFIINARDVDDAVPGLSKFFIVCFLKNLDKRKRYSILIEQSGIDEKKYDIIVANIANTELVSQLHKRSKHGVGTIDDGSLLRW